LLFLLLQIEEGYEIGFLNQVDVHSSSWKSLK
jgi:hypothetical protein